MALVEYLPWINVVLIPTFCYVVSIEKRIAKMEQGTQDRQGQRERRCPIETGRCPIVRQRFKTSWVEPENPPPWTKFKRREEDNDGTEETRQKMGQDWCPQVGKTTRPHAPDCPERQAIMNKFFMVFSQIMQILPLVMQAVEVFAPAKSGPVKKDLVKSAVSNLVTDDPAYDGLIDAAIETAIVKEAHKVKNVSIPKDPLPPAD
jgi:hypothetical protein